MSAFSEALADGQVLCVLQAALNIPLTPQSQPNTRVVRERMTHRPVEQVCREEIGELVALLKVALGMRRDELITETVRLLGYRSAGVNIRGHINDALSVLELDNQIHVQGEQARTLELG